ncbi:hypothetical protein BDZ89DRAFT_1068867 [Hymenopellis radicata]|nr:hypothetical protein BDZ89DRAFT_1068867 [Hymenopellis radicata]
MTFVASAGYGPSTSTPSLYGTTPSTFLSERAPPSGDLRALLRERMSEFQVTSDESFEASLMAGGYGRYKTVDGIEAPSAFTFPHPIAPVKPPSSYISDGLQVVELPGTGRVLVPSSTLHAKRSRAKKADAPASPISPYPVGGQRSHKHTPVRIGSMATFLGTRVGKREYWMTMGTVKMMSGSPATTSSRYYED